MKAETEFKEILKKFPCLSFGKDSPYLSKLDQEMLNTYETHPGAKFYVIYQT